MEGGGGDIDGDGDDDGDSGDQVHRSPNLPVFLLLLLLRLPALTRPSLKPVATMVGYQTFLPSDKPISCSPPPLLACLRVPLHHQFYPLFLLFLLPSIWLRVAPLSPPSSPFGRTLIKRERGGEERREWGGRRQVESKHKQGLAAFPSPPLSFSSSLPPKYLDYSRSITPAQRRWWQQQFAG